MWQMLNVIIFDDGLSKVHAATQVGLGDGKIESIFDALSDGNSDGAKLGITDGVSVGTLLGYTDNVG